MSAYLKEKYEESIKTRDAFISEMGDTFSQSNIDRLQTLQRLVSETKQALDDGSRETVEVEVGECRVHVLRTGKEAQYVMVPSGTTVAELVRSIGWPTEGMSFKKAVDNDTNIEVGSPETYSLTPGEHTLHVTPRVNGG